MSPVLRGFIVANLALCLGCGSSGPRCVSVSGTVTLDGGKVPGPGFIYFTMTESGEAGIVRPGTTEFDANGYYSNVTTFKSGDGLMPGKYQLRVDCYKTPPNMEGKPVVSFIPQKYQDASKSGLNLTVPGDVSRLTYDVALTSK